MNVLVWSGLVWHLVYVASCLGGILSMWHLVYVASGLGGIWSGWHLVWVAGAGEELIGGGLIVALQAAANHYSNHLSQIRRLKS